MSSRREAAGVCAWEQSRAAASGLAAVRVVERVVPDPVAPPKHGAWVDVLAELTRQLDTGQIYKRNLPALAIALDQVLHAYRRVTR